MRIDSRNVNCRPQEIPRTRSWPAASNLQPLQYARGAMAHEAQSHHPPPGRIRRTLAAEAQAQQRGEPLSSDILLTGLSKISMLHWASYDRPE